MMVFQLLTPLAVFATDQIVLASEATDTLVEHSEPVAVADETIESVSQSVAPALVVDDTEFSPKSDSLPVASIATAQIDQQLPQIQNDGHILISKVQIGNVESTKNEFVELYNNSDHTVSLAGWRLEFLTEKHNGMDAPTRILKSFTTQVLDPHSYYVVSYQGYLMTPVSDTSFDINVSSGSLPLNGAIRLRDSTLVVADLVGWGNSLNYETTASIANANGSIDRCIDKAGNMIDTNDNRGDLLAYSYADGLSLRSSPACAGQQNIDAPEVNMCGGVQLSEIHANTSGDQYIEVVNIADREVNLSGCSLQTNRSATARFTFSDTIIPANDYVIVFIKDTSLTLTKTTTGTVYLLSSDYQHEIDAQTYSSLPVDMSWARFDEGWQQTYDVTPGSYNQLRQHQSCAEGYGRNEQTGRCNKVAQVVTTVECGEGKYRSEDTGRCRQIPAASVLAACKLGQYRSEETNRCRNLVTANALTPCKENQYRSEETNRCRNLASAANQLVPCKENQERNPETNRCRNVTNAVPAAAFAVKPVGDSSKAFIGWWALGGVTMAALLYAGWEWRYEIRQWIRYIPTFSIRRK